MPGNGPEEERQRRDDDRDNDGNPHCTSQEQIPDVRLANSQGSEGCCLGLPEEHEDGIQFILMRDEEKDGKRKWNEELEYIK